MRLIRLLLPLLAVVGALFARRRKSTPGLPSHNEQPLLDPNALVNNIITPPHSEVAVEQLLSLLETSTVVDRVILLQPHQSALRPVLMAMLQEGKTHQRENAARLLGLIGGKNARDALLSALSDYSLWVRGAAAESLGKLADTTTTVHLAKALTDPEPYVRERAQVALEQIGGEDAEAVLETYANWTPTADTPNQQKRRSRSQSGIHFELADDHE